MTVVLLPPAGMLDDGGGGMGNGAGKPKCRSSTAGLPLLGGEGGSTTTLRVW